VAGSKGTRYKFGPPVPGGIMAPYANCYRCIYDKTYPDCDFYCLKQLDRIIDSSSSGDMGAVISEPYQGGAGFIFPPDGQILYFAKTGQKYPCRVMFLKNHGSAFFITN